MKAPTEMILRRRGERARRGGIIIIDLTNEFARGGHLSLVSISFVCRIKRTFMNISTGLNVGL